MKKFVVTIAGALVCLTAFGQGKLSFQTDSLHLVYYDPFAPVLGGQGVSFANMPAGVNLVADLYMGTSSSFLWLYSSTTFSAVPGRWNPLNVQANANATTGAPAIPGGTTVFIETQIRDQAFAAPNTFTGVPFGTYYGISQEFTFTLGSSIPYPFMFTSPSWTAGSFNMDQYGLGSRGAIIIPIPEPSTFGLAGFGAAALLFRRRGQFSKQSAS